MRRTMTDFPPPAAAPAAAGERPQETLRTEFAFELPRGYVDDSGTVHRSGVMRLATARDELVPLRDDRVREHPYRGTFELQGPFSRFALDVMAPPRA